MNPEVGGNAQLVVTDSLAGLGGALSLTFGDAGFHVILMARRAAILDDVAAAIKARGGLATPVVCDVTDDASVKAAFERARAVGPIEVLVYNVAPPFPGGVDFDSLPGVEAIDAAYLVRSFDIGVAGALRCAHQVLPAMVAAGRGSVLLGGATMALRGGKNFGCMSPIKFGLRSLGQTMYQEYAPKGVHVAHVVIDGVIASPNTRLLAQKVPGGLPLQNPQHLAEAFLALHHQPPTTWTHELQLSPNMASIGMRL